MKVVVVDCQGFTTSPVGFQVKELAFKNAFQIKNYLFKPKIPFRELNENDRKTVNYLCGKHHGIPYDSGNLNYDAVHEIVCRNLRNVDFVYVKGKIKEDFLTKIFDDIKHKVPRIVNLETVGDNVPNLDKGITDCNFHRLEHVSCTLRNVGILYNYIVGLLP